MGLRPLAALVSLRLLSSPLGLLSSPLWLGMPLGLRAPLRL